MCKECNRQFVENPSKKIIKDEEWDIVDKLLFERLSLSAISRVINISRRWIHEYIKTKREYVSNSSFQMPRKEKIYIEADELWSFVGNKKNEAWVWLAIERKTRLIVGYFVGKRAAESALGLWNSLSEDCKKKMESSLRTDLKHAGMHFQATDTKSSAKKAGKRALLNDLI